MAETAIQRLYPDGVPGKGMRSLNYIESATVSGGTAEEFGHLFFTNATGNVNVGVWACSPCTEWVRDYPYDQCCFVLEGSLTITDEKGHAETFGPGDAFVIPRGFNGLWSMTEPYKNFFVAIVPDS